MIQRIQTIYLLLTAVAIFLMFLFPFAEMLTSNGQFLVLKFNGIYSAEALHAEIALNIWPLAILISVTFLIAIVTIFLFKNRIRQMRFAIFNLLLLVGLGFLTWYYLNQFSGVAEGRMNIKFTITMPAIAVILTYLAFKGIQKDEKLIQSVNRIR